MLSLSEVRAILNSAFPGTNPVYQDAVAERMTLYLSFLKDWIHLFRGKMIDVGGQYGNFLCIAERLFPDLEAMTLTRYPLHGANTLALQTKVASVVSFHCERDQIPAPDRSYDVAVFTEVLEHLLYDPVWTMMEINRVLRMGGKLFLATPNAGSLRWIVSILKGKNPAGSIEYKPRRVFERHNRIYTSREVIQLLENLGFTVMGFSTVPSQKVLFVSKALRMLRIADREFPLHCGAETLIVAEKHTHFSPTLEYPKEVRWPSWLYSLRPELCVRPTEFVESEDDDFPQSGYSVGCP